MITVKMLFPGRTPEGGLSLQIEMLALPRVDDVVETQPMEGDDASGSPQGWVVKRVHHLMRSWPATETRGAVVVHDEIVVILEALT